MATAEEILQDKVDQYAGKDTDEDAWDLDALKRDLAQTFGLTERDFEEVGLQNRSTEELQDMLWERVKAKYEEKEKIVPRPDAPRRARLDAPDR